MGKILAAKDCIAEVFPGPRKPSLRTFQYWQARGLIPYRRIGKLVFYDPLEVRRAIDRQCLVRAEEVV